MTTLNSCHKRRFEAVFYLAIFWLTYSTLVYALMNVISMQDRLALGLWRMKWQASPLSEHR